MPLLEIDIEARYAKFQDALTAIQRDTKKAAGGMSTNFGEVKGALVGLASVASVGGFAALIKSNIDAADSLKDLSQETGIAVETLGGLGFAASLAGGTLDSIGDAAGKLNKSIEGAATGNKQFAEGFKALNIDIKDAEGNLKSADKVLVEIANKFQDYADGPEKVALATRLLGKAGAEQISLLNEGGRALQQNIEFYKRYGGVTQETADKADQFNDTLARLNLIGGAFGRMLAAEMLPSLNAVATALLEAKENGDGFEGWAKSAGDVFRLLTRTIATQAYVFQEWGIRVDAAAEKAKALSKGDFEGISLINDAENDRLDKAAESYLKLKNGINGTTKPGALEGFIGKYAKAIDDEKELLSTRNKVLENYRNEDQISDKAYNKAREANQAEYLANTRVFYDAQISGLYAQKVALQKAGKATEDVQAQIDELGKRKALVGRDKPRAPMISGAGSGKGAGKLLEGELRILQRQTEAEQRLLSGRIDFLQSYYADELLSINDYYDGRRSAQVEALRAQEAIIDKEIELLEASRPSDARESADQRNKIRELQDRKASLQTAAGLEGVKALVEQDRAARAFANTLESINAELLEQQGLLPQAASLRFDLANEQLQRRLDTERQSAAARNDAAGVAARDVDIARLASLRSMVVAQARLNSFGEIGAQVQFNLTEATERAQIAADQGNITELESMRLVSDARMQAVADLQQVASAFDVVARSSGDPRIIQQARALQLEVDKLAASADLVREKFQDAFSGPFESAIDKMISGTTSLKDVLKGLFSDIAGELAKLTSQDLSKRLFAKDGALGGVVDFAASAFGGSPAQASPSADIASSISKVTESGVDTAASAAAASALTTLSAATSAADAALITLSATIPIADAGIVALSATTLAADGAIIALAASATAAAAALAAVAGQKAGDAAVGIIGALASKDGNVFAGGNVIAFAKGGVPDIVSTPTNFRMKNGNLGLMGEAGPEAIMPLTHGLGGLSITTIDERGRTSLLPLTRDKSGRLAARQRAQAFEKGGVFSAGALRNASTSVFGMRTDTTPAAAGNGGPSVTVNVTPPPGSSAATAQQWGATAGRQIQNSLRRNG